MTLDVPVSAVGRPQRRRPVFATGAALLLVVGVALITSGTGGVSRLAVAGDDGTAAPARPSGGQFRVVAVGAEVHGARDLPEEIDCPDLDRLACLRIVRAALLALPPDVSSIRDITVWKSLLCSDELECPHRYLDGSLPLGSAVIRLADADRRVAINVVEWRHGDGIRLGPRAWLARSLPPAAASD